MIEAIILCLAVVLTLVVLFLAKRHGVVMRPDAGGLEALPKALHEAEMKKER